MLAACGFYRPIECYYKASSPHSGNRHPTGVKKDNSTRRNAWLRKTLSVSRREAVASSAMTGICDNYLGAFAIFLRASLPQMGMLSALPQLTGAVFQLLSVWLCSHVRRRQAIVAGVALQAVSVLGMALLALLRPDHSVAWLIGLAVVYQACANFVQPQWRSWMGSVVPARRRGAFFAGRTRLTMITSFTVFALGGAMLGGFQKYDVAWIGFLLLLLLAATGRGISAWQLQQMYDPDQHSVPGGATFIDTLRRVRESFHHRAFREYSLFFGALLGGYLASALPDLVTQLPQRWQVEHSVVLIFATSALLRVGIVVWFIPRSVELRVRRRPDLLQVVYRVARFTPGAGVVLDWLTVTRKTPK